MPGNGHTFPSDSSLELSFELTWLGVGVSLKLLLVCLPSVQHKLQILVVIPYA